MKTWLLLAAAVGISGCYDRANYVYGESLDGLKLELYSENEGIHPDTSVLDDPNNPFALNSPGEETKWDIQSSGDRVAAFYAWSTLLARGPYGEAQFYVATNLQGIYLNGEAAQEDLPQVRQQAIRAFQSVLDNFPDAVTYDATGTNAYELLTPAFKGIVDLGGTVQGGWVLVVTSNDQERAVKP
ncbi:hypothetical protein HPC49_09380 [Pyxidicoccus fallax]|uniref:Lipoprotein n=1 Tax=Pyxidicoccus fallax TaxID=394095 RepID=A0A848L8T2_9BACT|nr:hypothetical protein [Pyxidicoccus fallax]NMO14662.1 hypothetical protein [Pyxidicoccus fallax]NPC78453.1 hypothetical protein [Pyxidicoccus fallax]